MASTDYKAIHTAIKDLIKGKGFKYLTGDKWFDKEQGSFPEPLKGSAFTIRFIEQEESEREAVEWSLLSIEVEFALEVMNDKYLEKLGACQDAIVALKGITSQDLILISTNTLDNWSALYQGDRAMVTFNNLTFEVRSR